MTLLPYPGFISTGKFAALKEVSDFLNGWMSYLFPFPDHEETFLADHQDQQLQLIQQLKALLKDGMETVAASEKSDAFLHWLPELMKALLADARWIADTDPAASGMQEVIAVYPGFRAIAYYRIAHWLYSKSLKILARQVSETAHILTGIDIHPGAIIGIPFSIDHGTGIVIGETAVIGHHCLLYQGVTLGAVAVKKTLAFHKRHPTLGNNVIVYANATILGGSTIIGHEAIIGGNCWVTESVPDAHVVLTVQQNKIMPRGSMESPYNFVI